MSFKNYVKDIDVDNCGQVVFYFQMNGRSEQTLACFRGNAERKPLAYKRHLVLYSNFYRDRAVVRAINIVVYIGFFD